MAILRRVVLALPVTFALLPAYLDSWSVTSAEAEQPVKVPHSMAVQVPYDVSDR